MQRVATRAAQRQPGPFKPDFIKYLSTSEQRDDSSVYLPARLHFVFPGFRIPTVSERVIAQICSDVPTLLFLPSPLTIK